MTRGFATLTLALAASLIACDDADEAGAGADAAAGSGAESGGGGQGSGRMGGHGAAGGTADAAAGGAAASGGAPDVGAGGVDGALPGPDIDGGEPAPDPRECAYREPSGLLDDCTAEREGLQCSIRGCLRNSEDSFFETYVCEGGDWQYVESDGNDCALPSDTCAELGAAPGGGCTPEQENIGCDRSEECPDGNPFTNYLRCDGAHWSMGDECF